MKDETNKAEDKTNTKDKRRATPLSNARHFRVRPRPLRLPQGPGIDNVENMIEAIEAVPKHKEAQ